MIRPVDYMRDHEPRPVDFKAREYAETLLRDLEKENEQ